MQNKKIILCALAAVNVIASTQLVAQPFTQEAIHSWTFAPSAEDGKKVKQIHTYNYTADRLFYEELYKYNENGMLTFYSIQSPYGDSVTEEVFYDQQGRFVKDIRAFEDGVYEYEIQYDAKGNLCYVKQKDQYDEVLEYIQEFDDDGNCIKYVEITDGEITNTKILEYDTEGNIIRLENYFDDTRLYEYKTTSYLSKGVIETETTYNPDGSKKHSIHYTYNAEGKLIKEIQITYDPYENTSSVEYEYNSDGLLVKETVKGKSDNVILEYYYEYDSLGDLSLTQKYNISPKAPQKKLDLEIAAYSQSGKCIFEFNNNYKTQTFSTYNSEGLVTSKKTVTASGKVLSDEIIEYEFY